METEDEFVKVQWKNVIYSMHYLLQICYKQDFLILTVSFANNLYTTQLF